nr:ImpA family metalloprotease [Chitinibacter fontanus]
MVALPTPVAVSTTKPTATAIPVATVKPVASYEPVTTAQPNSPLAPTATSHPIVTLAPNATDAPDSLPTTPPDSPNIPPANIDLAKQALRLATARAVSYQQAQSAAISDIYGDSDLNLTLNHTTNSIEIQRSNSTSAIPLIVADDGSGMAAISTYGKGRALAYGANVLNWMANQSRETQHLPLFTRAFNWVMTGKATGPLPATIKFATAGYDASTVSKFITLLGKAPESITCDLTAANNSCWQEADLLVFGSAVRNDPDLAILVRQYQASGKAIIYMHPNWGDSAGGRKVLQAVGMELGGYPGNYYAPLAGVSVGASRTATDSIQKADSMGALVSALILMDKDTPDPSINTNVGITNAISQLQDEMAWMQRRGIDILTNATTELHRLLINWADLYRPSIQYGTIFRSRDPAKFLRTYASDSWVAYNRGSTMVSPTGQGDYMPAAAQSIPVSAASETIEVTIAQSSGITAIGRGAIPGQPVYIEVVDDGGTSGLNLQTSYVRAYGNPLTDNEKEGYKRPREPQSFPIPLPDSGESVFVTPFGGPLFLNYSGATAGRSVTLKIRGAAKYAHFDFTKPQSDAEIADAIAALNRADFGWQTSKFVGGEIQQTIYYAKQAIGNTDPKKVIIDQVKGSLFDSNHIANGYNNMPLSNNVSTLCSQFSWDCTGPIHRAPGVQHFIGWIAQCGFLCSGNPSDGFAGIGGTGWGHAHELGHNTVQRVMTITFNGKGCVVECNNNVLASIQMMRQFKTLGIDTGHNTDHPGLYQRIVANRNSGMTGDAKVLDMQTNLWDMNKGQDPMRAVHFQLAFLFSKYRALESIPSMEATLDYFTLLTKGDRLVSKAWDANSKDKYAMGSFSNNTISNPDLLFVLSSKIIGKDLRAIFAMYGMSVSQTALDSVAALGLPVLPEEFYALALGKHNQVSNGQWLNLANQTPIYPY